MVWSVVYVCSILYTLLCTEYCIPGMECSIEYPDLDGQFAYHRQTEVISVKVRSWVRGARNFKTGEEPLDSVAMPRSSDTATAVQQQHVCCCWASRHPTLPGHLKHFTLCMISLKCETSFVLMTNNGPRPVLLHPPAGHQALCTDCCFLLYLSYV